MICLLHQLYCIGSNTPSHMKAQFRLGLQVVGSSRVHIFLATAAWAAHFWGCSRSGFAHWALCKVGHSFRLQPELEAWDQGDSPTHCGWVPLSHSDSDFSPNWNLGPGRFPYSHCGWVPLRPSDSDFSPNWSLGPGRFPYSFQMIPKVQGLSGMAGTTRSYGHFTSQITSHSLQ
jgi:hypothetical protein